VRKSLAAIEVELPLDDPSWALALGFNVRGRGSTELDECGLPIAWAAAAIFISSLTARHVTQPAKRARLAHHVLRSEAAYLRTDSDRRSTEWSD